MTPTRRNDPVDERGGGLGADNKIHSPEYLLGEHNCIQWISRLNIDVEWFDVGVLFIAGTYKGYQLYNGSGLPSVRIPYNLTLPKPAADLNAWRVQVVARSGKYSDETTSLGISGGAESGDGYTPTA